LREVGVAEIIEREESVASFEEIEEEPESEGQSF